MNKSTAIVFPEAKKAALQTYEPAALRAGELLVRTEFSGVSQGTEIWAYNGQRPELKFPTVPGYQTVGIVEQIGEGVTAFSKGQRVMFHASRLPSDWPETWMAGHVSLAVVNVAGDPAPQVIPDGTDPVAAVLSAMAAVSLRGVEMVNIRFGDLVVVMGQGLIGQAAAQLARARGATVIATDLSPKRLELGRAHSADHVINPKTGDLGALVRKLRPNGADVVIETTGRAEAFKDCIDLLRWEGSLLLQGYYPKPITFDFHHTHMKKPTIAVSCGIGDTRRTLELIRHGKLHWREMVTDLVDVREAPAIYERMAANDPDMLGVVFDWRKL
jgi:3-hydroxyethyl bacteriochlorophyllide a dehydrogenase